MNKLLEIKAAQIIEIIEKQLKGGTSENETAKAVIDELEDLYWENTPLNFTFIKDYTKMELGVLRNTEQKLFEIFKPMLHKQTSLVDIPLLTKKIITRSLAPPTIIINGEACWVMQEIETQEIVIIKNNDKDKIKWTSSLNSKSSAMQKIIDFLSFKSRISAKTSK